MTIRWAPLAILFALPLPASAADRASPQAVVDAAYAALSDANGQPDVAQFTDLFTTGARFVRVRADATDGIGHPSVVDVRTFITAFREKTAGKPFYETGHTVHANVQTTIATIISDYESKASPDGAPFERGRNTFELIRTEKGWQIDSIFWENVRGK